MPTMHDERLTVDELAGALAAWGLSVTSDSPLVGLPPAGQVLGAQVLRARGLLDEPWGQALRALQNPSGCFRTLIPLPERIVVQAYYAGAAGDVGGLVGCWPEPPGMRIRFPLTTEDLLRNSSSLLLADFPAMTDPFRAEFTPAGLAALAAAADVLRQRLFEAMLRRQGEISTGLAAGQLGEVYAQGWRASDARWLVTLFRLVMPSSIPLPRTLSPAGLGELARAGLLSGERDPWQATEHLLRLAAWWKTPLPALAQEVVALDGGQLRDYGYLIALRGDGPLWLFEFWQDSAGRPTITLRSRTGLGFRHALRTLCRPLEGPGRNTEAGSGPASTAQPAVAPSVGTPTVADAAQRDVAFCPQCGTPRRAGARFCTGCGGAFPPGPDHVS